MNPKRQYILVALMVIMVYLLYLIVLYKYREYQVSSYISYIRSDIETIQSEQQTKKTHLAYVKTRAFLDKMIKLSQNKKNFGEEVVFLVSEEDMKNAKDTPQIINPDNIVAQEDTKTTGMSISEKWGYYLFGAKN